MSDHDRLSLGNTMEAEATVLIPGREWQNLTSRMIHLSDEFRTVTPSQVDISLTSTMLSRHGDATDIAINYSRQPGIAEGAEITITEPPLGTSHFVLRDEWWDSYDASDQADQYPHTNQEMLTRISALFRPEEAHKHFDHLEDTPLTARGVLQAAINALQPKAKSHEQHSSFETLEAMNSYDPDHDAFYSANRKFELSVLRQRGHVLRRVGRSAVFQYSEDKQIKLREYFEAKHSSRVAKLIGMRGVVALSSRDGLPKSYLQHHADMRAKTEGENLPDFMHNVIDAMQQHRGVRQRPAA